ncbi:MAG: glutathione S-transferase family protein [Parvibaculaceae bacterium]|nr:glutathione S-transferase family protein [Parvibaculaceae bacterium]
MTMILYNAQLSPFAARCRIALYARSLEVEMRNMPGAISEDAYAELAPMGKIPLLVHDGYPVPESEVICEYLDEIGAGPRLMPADPRIRAQARIIARIGDLYLMPPLQILFGQINPVGRDPLQVAKNIEEVGRVLVWLGHYLADDTPYAVGDRLSLADCMIMPQLFFVMELGPLFGELALVPKQSRVARYYAHALRDRHIARVIEEMKTALMKLQGY